MKEVREKIRPLLEFLSYKIRAGEISQEGSDTIYRIILKNPDLTDKITYILEMDLPERDTVMKVQQLVK